MAGCYSCIEKIKLKKTDETTEMVSELVHISFYNNQGFFANAGTISLNCSRLSICQMFLFLENFL